MSEKAASTERLKVQYQAYSDAMKDLEEKHK